MSGVHNSLSLGQALAAVGRHAEALEVGKSLLAAEPGDLTLTQFAATYALKCGEAAYAEDVARQALVRHPSDPALLTLLADALVALGRHREAIACLERTLALRSPGQPADHIRIGRLAHYLGDHDTAVTWFLSALALDPDSAEAYDALSKVSNSASRPEAAREWRESKPQPPEPEGLGDFVNSEAVSELSDAEYRRALTCLDAIDSMIASRQALPASHVGRPSGQWDLKDSLYSRVLQPRDRDVIRKLRFYTQEFTGLRLPFFDAARGRPRIDFKLPAEMDAIVSLLVPERESSFAHASYMNALPEGLAIPSPGKFAEIGWDFRGGILNLETLYVHTHLLEIFRYGLIDMLAAPERKAPPVVLEIGAGYGALAYRLARLVPNIRYVVVDLPESLAFSAIYLTTLFPEAAVEFVDIGGRCAQLDQPGFSFVSNAAFAPDLLGSSAIDLALNTMSLGEMSDRQVETYGAGVAAMMAETGAFLEQNHSCLDGFDYVGRLIAPYFEQRQAIEKRPGGFIFPGQGHLWSRPRAATARAHFAELIR